MGRNLLWSDYAAGKPAWIDWIVFGILLTISFVTLFNDGSIVVVALSGVAATGFGTFLTVVEFRKLIELQ